MSVAAAAPNSPLAAAPPGGEATVMRLASLSLVVVVACSGGDGAAAVDAPVDERAPELVGLWVVEQPFHALYERTFYRLDADGAVAIGPSEPADCTGHLARHCVTGSVANCLPRFPEETCVGTPTCVFGARWRSAGPRVMILDGVCDDGVARPIALQLSAAAVGDPDGGLVTVLTVGGEPGWSHDNWVWSFRKCPPGTTPETCAAAPR